MSQLYIGLMSGTSLDGVDGVVADFSTQQPRVLGYAAFALPNDLKQELFALNYKTDNELHRAALAANDLVKIYAAVVQQLLRSCQLAPSAIRAIGAHGQTVRHRPGEFDGIGYTLQLNQPALLAEMCDIDVVADFRSRDLAAGGQGAPLVPPFHEAFFGVNDQVCAVLNVGGISNITVWQHRGDPLLTGFDCGPGNALMDAWCMAHTGAAFDDAGHWARSGTVHPDLLRALLAESFFAKAAPKSTGRDLFNMPWLKAHLSNFEAITACDVQATLLELTARCCAQSFLDYAPHSELLVVCGGGAYNQHLINRIGNLVHPRKIASSEAFGLPPLQVEATAFAWLAQQALAQKTASLACVTGAKGNRILGAVYYA